MMQNQLFMAAILVLFTTQLSLADDKQPTPPAENKQEHEKAAIPVLEAVEEIRQQLGPEFSIESEEFGIERDQAIEKPTDGEWHATDEWPGTKLYQEVRELVGKFRQNARHLEELAGQAEQMSEYGLADQLREIARHQWEHARELSKPRSTRPYYSPSPTNPPQPYGAQPAMATPHWGTPYYQPPTTDSPTQAKPPYGAPSAPSQRFSVPDATKPKTR